MLKRKANSLRVSPLVAAMEKVPNRALKGALAVQQELDDASSAVSEDRRMRFRS